MSRMGNTQVDRTPESVLISQLEGKLRSSEKLLHFTRQHHAITVSDLQREVASLRQRCSELNFKLHVVKDEPAAVDQSAKGATDKSDEVSHLLSEIEQLRCTNSELRTSLQYSRKCVELMTCCSCAGKLQKSGQSRDGQTEELDAKKRDEQATSESSRRKLHSKSRSLPANHSIGRSNSRKLPPLPSESQESSVPRPASASSSPVPNTPNNPPSDIVPHPPSTPRPKGRRSRPLLVRSYTTVGISAELSAVLLDYDTMFGQPPVALWELPYRQQVYGARLEYHRALLLNRERPPGIPIPPKPRQDNEMAYLISRGVVASDGKTALRAQPPRHKQPLPPIVDRPGSGTEQLKKRSRNAYAGPRLANDEVLAHTTRTLNALSISQGPSGAHSAVDLLTTMGTTEDVHQQKTGKQATEHVAWSKGEEGQLKPNRRSSPASRKDCTQQAAYEDGGSPVVDVHDTDLSHHLPPIDREGDLTASCHPPPLHSQAPPKVILSPYLAQRSNKLAARAAVRERTGEQRALYGKDVNKQKPPMQQSTGKK